MDLDQALKLLDEVRVAMHEQFNNPPRLEQLDRHAATVRMVVTHLFDEASRET